MVSTSHSQSRGLEFESHSSATLVNRDLSNDDHDGSENVAKKMNLRSFKLNCVYLDLLNVSNAGDFS